jgi:hypothetical protein
MEERLPGARQVSHPTVRAAYGPHRQVEHGGGVVQNHGTAASTAAAAAPIAHRSPAPTFIQNNPAFIQNNPNQPDPNRSFIRSNSPGPTARCATISRSTAPCPSGCRAPTTPLSPANKPLFRRFDARRPSPVHQERMIHTSASTTHPHPPILTVGEQLTFAALALRESNAIPCCWLSVCRGMRFWLR